MKNEKLETISNLFEGKEIRSIWDAEKEEYYFSVVDVIKALTDSNNPNDYWYRLKKRMTDEEKAQIKEIFQKTAELNKTLDKYDTDKKSYWIEFLEACGQYFDSINH